ncbi:hypothetical protein QFC21_004561 [Naganishia friedmannii]|uniref:Uncharacterized protein n=1 Tax=Naganishia friedmannii TaxID=89922 RepID=A0ACC2VH22_9TREE|nr:hypothetical protein QFC21_004561 [Naganishia friedmannii]
MIKLNRLLGARVPPELLGTARSPPFSPFVVQEPDAKAADVVTEAEDSAKKTRAVKVTSKMYYVFGELPPPNRYLADASSTPHTSHPKRSSRSALRAHVDSYYQSIQSIRYLLENDRQSLEHVIGDIQEDAVPVDGLLEETDKDVASAAEQEAGEAHGLQRQRSLSTPCLPTGLPSHKRSFKTANASAQATDNLNIESLTSLRKRAAKLNSFFGDPRIGSGHIGRQSKQYIITDKKVALEKLLLELEDNANFDAEQGDLEEQELSEIRSQLLSVRRSASLLIVAPDASIADAA